MKRVLALFSIAVLTFPLFWSCSEKEQEIPVSSVTLSQPVAEMIIGESITLRATLSPSNSTEREIFWASSKQSVASVDQGGKVVAIAEGTSTITATAGGKVGSCVVTVGKGVVEVSSITLNKTNASLKVGETVTLSATVKPDDATDKTVTWKASDVSVAEVNNGVVTAKKIGTATIIAKTGDKEATCAITVEATPVTSISLNKDELSLIEGDSETLVATVKPDDATDKTVIWTSSNSSIATVENGKVTAIKEGSTIITAKAGEKQASCVVIVSPKVVHVEGIVLNKTNIEIDVGSSFELIATVYPETATNKGIIWISSNDNIATVEAGIVKGLYPGEATIKAITIDGTFEAICNVKVNVSEFKGLTFTSSGESSIGLVKIGSPGAITLEYSKNGLEWQQFNVGDNIALSDGEKLMFRAGANKNKKFSSSTSNYYKFSNSGSGAIAASGNVMSLLDRDCSTPLSSCVFWHLFENFVSLTSAPELPATTLKDRCYGHMFEGCINLTTAPTLPATTLADYCYSNMFNGCSSLTSAPALPATTLAQGCYSWMFVGCVNVTTAPTLPATTLANRCYENMFAASGLISAPSLPATKLAEWCYGEMFSFCEKLISAPALPATTLADYCYYRMFNYCQSLTTAPNLLATTLAAYCYWGMFDRCSKLNYVKALFTTTPSSIYTDDWLNGVSSTGIFVKSSAATWDVTGPDGIPSGWTVQTE